MVETLYKSRMVPKIKLQKIDQEVGNVADIGKLLWDEWCLAFVNMH